MPHRIGKFIFVSGNGDSYQFDLDKSSFNFISEDENGDDEIVAVFEYEDVPALITMLQDIENNKPNF